MLDEREIRAREEAVRGFARLHPEYVKLDDHPDKELILWAVERALVFLVDVAGTKFVGPDIVEQAKMWKGKLN